MYTKQVCRWSYKHEVDMLSHHVHMLHGKKLYFIILSKEAETVTMTSKIYPIYKICNSEVFRHAIN